MNLSALFSEKKYYKPNRILLDRSGELSDFGQAILDRLPDVPIEEVSSVKDAVRAFALEGGSAVEAKRTLLLTVNKGRFFEACPGCTDQTVRCNYYTLNWGTNCDMACSYCFLQGYLNNPFITVYTNLPEMLEKLAHILDRSPDRFMRVGAGEYADSLSLDPLVDLSGVLVPFFADYPNAVLEMKTKSTLIERLIQLDCHDNLLVSWSLNTEEIQQAEEHGTALISERLAAARQCVDAGLRVAFHFDPIIFHEDWQDAYSEVIDKIYRTLPKERIAWFSLSTLRFRPEVKSAAAERFPRARIYAEEFVRDRDGKYRYPRKLRRTLQKFLMETIRRKDPEAKIYLCMERDFLWQETLGFRPESPRKVNLDLKEKH